MAEPDWKFLEEQMNNPDDFYQGDEAMARMNAAIQKSLNVTGPKVEVEDLPGGRWRLNIDFDDIEVRSGSGRDQRRS